MNWLSCNIHLFDIFCELNIDLVFFWCLPFFLILLFNEVLDRFTQLPREVHRKIGHVLSGLLIIASSYHLGQLEMMVFSIVMVMGAFVSKLIHFKTIYSVTRKTFGTVLYGFVVGLLAMWWLPEQGDLFRFGIWLLVVPDALAAVIGSRWGKQIPWFNKSLLGSGTFFLGTVAVCLCFTQIWWVVLLIALSLTLVEFLSQWGIDNLLLPVIGSVMLYHFLQVVTAV